MMKRFVLTSIFVALSASAAAAFNLPRVPSFWPEEGAFDGPVVVVTQDDEAADD